MRTLVRLAPCLTALLLLPAAAAPDVDGVYLGSGTFTAPSPAGFSYYAFTGPVHIVGKGGQGANRTTLTTPAASRSPQAPGVAVVGSTLTPQAPETGRYAIRVTAVDASSNRSRPKTPRFRVGAAKAKR